MSSAHQISTLKCKKCNDMILTGSVSSHYCTKSDNETKKLHKIKKAFSVDRHCAVPENGVPCRNSLTCRVHSLDQRNEVKGRIYPVEDLIRILKREKNKKRCIQVGEPKPLDFELKNKAFDVIKGLKPVVEYKFDDQKFLRESKEIRSIFSTLKKDNNHGTSMSSTPVNEKNSKKVGLATRKYRQRTPKQSSSVKQ
ncbi:Nuclear protein Ataxin-7 [Trachipleistophora hominis]|uniref:Nuclear protein Ataxin-7 n=1 Tax=Trachipleistophora hominis TaxID=72359 RepID=L7JRV9_TRAHO|nr:Nuclear protein Ataxin-7 [Trachipleistophora hominis]